VTTPEPVLVRRLRLVDAVAVVLSACIGIGIFFSPAEVVARTGSGGWAMIAWAAGGLVAIVGGLCFAELGVLRPRMGGQYRMLREAWGPAVGTAYAGTGGLVIGPGAIAVLAGCGTDFLAQALGVQPSPAAWTVCSIGILLALGLVNWIGIRRAADLMDVLTLAKVVTIGALAWAGLWMALHDAPRHDTSPFALGTAPTPTGFLHAMLPVLFATGGWQQVLWMGGDIREPARNIPRALFLGIASVLLAYLAVNASCLWLLGPQAAAASKTIASDAMSVWWTGAGRWLAAAIGLSAIGTTHVILMTTSREQAAFGQTGDGPRWIAPVDPVSGAARRSVGAMTLWACALLVIAGRDGISSLLDAVVMADFTFLGLCALSVLVLRRRHPDEPRPFRCPLGPVLPLTFGGVSACIAVTPWLLPEQRPWALAVTCIVGGLLALGWVRSRRAGSAA